MPRKADSTPAEPPESGAAADPTAANSDAAETAPLPPHLEQDVDRERTTMSGRKLLDRYEVLNRLGEGGMGVVYRVRDRELDVPLAIKVLQDALAHHDDQRERFKDELKTARQVTHRNVVRIHELMFDGDDAFITMEYLPGGTLADRIPEAGMPWEGALPIALQIAEGLAAAHDMEVIHRDIKPQNVLFDARDQAKLADFGVAQFAAQADGGGLAGTPYYMSPEQIDGVAASKSGDVYAFGVLLYRVLTGRYPFDGATVAEVFRRHREDPPRSVSSLAPDVPLALEALVMRCLAKDPQARPSDAHALVGDLRTIMENLWQDAVVRLRGRGSRWAHLLRRAGVAVSRPWTRWAMGAAAAALGALVVAQGDRIPMIRGAARGMYDYLATVQRRHPLHAAIVPIVVDDSAIHRVGRWPWPRSQSAVLLEATSPARVVVGDLLYSGQSADPLEDEALVRTLGTRGDFLLAMAGWGAEVDDTQLGALSEDEARAQATFRERFLPGLPPADGAANGVPELGRLGLPIHGVVETAGGLGFTNTARDDDGTIRRVPLLRRYRGRLLPGMALLAAARYLGVPEAQIRLERHAIILPHADTATGPSDIRIPVNDAGEMWVPFAQGATTLYGRVVPAATLLGPDPPRVEDKLVVLYTAFSGGTDYHPTPRDKAFPGGLILTESISAILDQRFIRWAPDWALLLGVLAVAMLAVVASHRPAAWYMYILITPAAVLLVWFFLMARYLVYVDALPLFATVFLSAPLLGVRTSLIRYVRTRL